MVSQRNFDAIVQADLDNLDVDQKMVVPYTATGINQPTTTSTTSSYFVLETNNLSRFMVPAAGYVSRVWGVIDNSTPHADETIDLSLGVRTRTGPASTSTFVHNLPGWAPDDHNYLETFTTTDIPVAAEDDITLEWATTSGISISGALRATVWVEVTFPA